MHDTKSCLMLLHLIYTKIILKIPFGDNLLQDIGIIVPDKVNYTEWHC